MPEKAVPPHTDFDQLAMSFKINHGIFTTDNLNIRAQDYTVNGQGNVNAISQNIDLTLNAHSTHDKNFFIPIKITGPITDPSFRPDIAIILQQSVKKSGT